MSTSNAGFVDRWYMFARRTWTDGMTLESCATSVITYTDDGGMVVDVLDDDGNGAIFVVDPDTSKVMRAMQESIFTGVGVMEIPIPA